MVVAPLIDGGRSASRSEALVEVVNPSNGRMLFSIPAGSPQDVDGAVAAARRAFEDGRWSGAPPSFRKAALARLADLIEGEAHALDVLDATEMGKPVREEFGNAASAASLMRYYAEAVDKITGQVYSSDKRSFVAHRWVPRGVVGAVVPWNFPTAVAVMKAGPALAAGNCLVLKPSELASRSAMRIGELALQAGVPPGVFNVVPGLGGIVGRALGLHADVDMLAFTGSTEVGKLMLQYSGQSNLKVVMAECGGKSPHVVFDDGIDIEAVVESVARPLLTNQGQICSVGSRLIVQRSVETRMLQGIAECFSRITMGDALDPHTTFGPLASAKQCERVMGYIESAEVEGAQRVTGGRRALTETGGYFVEPTLFRNVSPAARIAQEEIFGPVLAVISFDDEAEAVRIANGTRYGLGAYVWTADLSRGMRLAESIRSSVRISAAPPSGAGAGCAAGCEPALQSGIGMEGGIAGIESYMRRQRVWITH